MRAAYEYFTTHGWSPAQAAGILGHLSGESGTNLDPDSFNSAGGGMGARGIGQWRGPRILAFRRMFGHDPLDQSVPRDQRFREQLAFVDWELANTERAAGTALHGATDPGAAADLAMRLYGRGEPWLASRAPAGQRIYQQFGGPPGGSFDDVMKRLRIQVDVNASPGTHASASVTDAPAGATVDPPRVRQAMPSRLDR
jgi:hypothetical protein